MSAERAGGGRAAERPWTVPLPPDVTEPFEVFVNGVAQARGVDYDLAGRTLEFRRPLAQEGRLGFWRWTSIFLGIAGTYRPHDNVDVAYESEGRRRVASALPVVPPERG